MGDELLQSPTKVPLAERDDSIQTFLLHGPDKPFRLRVAVRRTRRYPDYANASRGEPLLDGPAPLRIAIANQDAPRPEQRVWLAGGLPQALNNAP